MTDSLAPWAVPPVSPGAIEEATRRAKDPPDWLLALQPGP